MILKSLHCVVFAAISFVLLASNFIPAANALGRWRCYNCCTCEIPVCQSCEALKSQLQKNQKDLADLSAQKKVLNSKLSILINEKNILEKELSDANAKLQAEKNKKELTEKIDNIKAALAEKNIIINEDQEKINSLEKKSTEQENLILELKNQLKSAEELLTSLKPVLEKTNRFLTEQNAVIEKLEEELKTLKGQKADSESINAKIDEIKIIIGRKQQLIDELSPKNEDKENAFTALNKDIIEQIQRRIEAENRSVDSEIAYAKLDEEKIRLAVENGELKETVKRQNSEIASLRQQVKDWENRYKSLKSKSDSLQTKYEELMKALDGVKNQKEALDKINSFKNEIKTLKKERDDALAENAELKKKFADNQSELEKVQKKLNEMSSKYDVLRTEKKLTEKFADTQIADYKKYLDDLNNKFDTACDEKARLQKECEELSKKVNDSETFFGSLNLMIDSVANNIEKINAGNYASVNWSFIVLPSVCLLILLILFLAFRRSKKSAIQEAFDSYQNKMKF